jgi:hypothetical protein
VKRPVTRAVLGLALSGAFALPADAQRPGTPVPFEIGEHLTYDVRFGAIKVGNGRLSVMGIDTVRGIPAWHVRFGVRGGTFFYKVDDVYDSWMDMRTLNSLRYVQDTEQGSSDARAAVRDVPGELHVPRGPQGQPDHAVRPGPARRRLVPLLHPHRAARGRGDVRVQSLLQAGPQSRHHPRAQEGAHPRPGRHVRCDRAATDHQDHRHLLRGRQAEIWLSDDEKRIMLQMKSRLSFGSLNLYLRTYRYTTPDTTADPSAAAR